MLTQDFLNTVVTSSEPGYFCLAVSNGSGWLEEWHRWPDDIDKIVARAEAQATNANVYFSSYLFKAPQSTKENVLPSRTIQADLDDADLNTLPKAPTILVQTSPGRHQAYWVLDTALDPHDHEVLSRKLTYSIPLCDRSGWPLGKKVRVPNTLNHKYLDGPKPITVLDTERTTPKPYSPDEFEALPEVPSYLVEHYDLDFIEGPTAVDTHPLEILEAIKENIPVKVYVQYGQKQEDRSEALWALLCWGFKAGLDRNQVFTLAKGSANNKFADLQHRADQDLAKDVLRAEHTVRTNQQDSKVLIYNVFKSSLPIIDRKRNILTIVLDELKRQGEFINAHGGLGWYIRRDVGRPIAITPASEHLQTLLDIQFGLNNTEPEAKYVAHGLRAYVSNLPETGHQSALAHYDPHNKYLLLHTGRREVLKITADGVENIVNGAYGIIFPWGQSTEPFTPLMRASANVDWGEELFGNGSRGFGTSVENVSNMTPSQALALLRVWVLFVLFRNVANTRPILASFGQPGSGKTVMFKKIYCLLYGRKRGLSAVTTVDDFDHATANDPLVVLDNVDTWEKWLPDRIALSAGTTDVIKRRLYTDTDTITLRRQAIIGVTAHNPKFGREDVADRFLLFSFLRFARFVSEELILADIHSNRNLLWGAIIRDVQRILQTDVPQSGVPQFRIEDFARYGMWIAKAIGVEDDFKASIEDVKSSQEAFNLEEEGLLVGAIQKYAAQTKNGDKYFTAAQMWSMLEACSDDPPSFNRVYRNSVLLSKKLSSMQASLQRIVDIDLSSNEAGARTWRIRKKDGSNS